MMAGMQPISKSARARSGPTEEFVELCKTLYGDAVDPEIVWTDVIKLSPDQADVNAQKTTRRRVLEGVALGSTVAGGILGVKEGVSGFRGVRRTLKATGRVAGKDVRSLALAGAATGGDAITTGVLASDQKKHTASKAVRPPRDLRPQVDGLRKLWKTPAGNTLAPTGKVSKKVVSLGDAGELLARQNAKRGLAAPGLRTRAKVGARSNPAVQTPEPPAPAAPQLTRAQIRERESRAARGDRYQQRQAVTEDAKAMLGTNTGKVAAGAGALYLGSKLASPRSESAYYGKSADEMEFRGEFSKFDDAKKQAFGWASVVKVNGEDVVDRQGDYIDLNDLEDAAYAYVHKSRVGGDMHRRAGEAPHKVSDMIESMVFTDDKVAKMGLPDDFPRGWWVGYQIHDDATWDEVRKKGRTGFSIHGKGLRKDYDLDERR